MLHFHATYTQSDRTGGPLVRSTPATLRASNAGVGLLCNNREATHRWHEPAEFFAIDDTQPLVGTGVEDYFCLAWGFRRRLSRERFGVTCMRPHGGSPTLEGGGFNPAGEYAMYRFHADDPVPFERSLRRRSFGLDVLACAACGGRLRLVATIADPRVIARILAHLGLPLQPPPPLPPAHPSCLSADPS
ncbi:DUF2961 domain-containing protein [bacterium]|nr:DUF2961 domain-containing protein [bacterium]